MSIIRHIPSIIFGLVVTITAAYANPQEQPQPVDPEWQMLPSFVNCSKIVLIEELTTKYGEQPFAKGQSTIPIPGGTFQGEMRMYVDPQDGSFTTLLMINDEVGCIVILGQEFVPWIENKNSL